MSAVRRVLLFLGAVHLAQLVAAAWLARHWRAVVVELAQAVVDEQQHRQREREQLRERAAEFDREAIAAMECRRLCSWPGRCRGYGLPGCAMKAEERRRA